MSLQSGQTLGNYQVLERVGSGGMGEVYLAAHPLIGKRVALKVIHRELAQNREVVTRFFNEAKAVNTVGSDHIVEVHDFGQTDDGHYFFIMEFLSGRTLADELMRQRQLEPERAGHIAAQIASGLGAAHQHAIIHRDLKPDNIMLVDKLGDPDFVKILDFGLAKCLADGGPQLTAAGVVLGTPQYMSPEAAEGRNPVDHRADIYSLGVLMFQMVCGRVPFDAPSMGEILVKHVAHPPPAPRAFNANISPALEQIILRCLAKKPEERFETMEALREALLDPDRYLSSSPPVARAAATDGRPPEMRQPVPAHKGTMRIASPVGLPRADGGSRPWAIAVAMLAAAAVIGGIAALAVSSGSGGEEASASTDSTESVEKAADAVVAVDLPDAALAVIVVDVATTPEGAHVIDEDGTILATTPAQIELVADGAQRTWTIEKDRYVAVTKEFVAESDMAWSLEMMREKAERKRRQPTEGGGSSGTGKKKASSDLMVPDI